MAMMGVGVETRRKTRLTMIMVLQSFVMLFERSPCSCCCISSCALVTLNSGIHSQFEPNYERDIY